MPDRRNLSRLAIASLLAVAVCAPMATAKPIDDGGVKSKAHAPSSAAMDMHASTVKKPASANQDLRTEASVPGARPPVSELDAAQVTKPDLRSENAADPSRAPEPPVGLPTWPLDPKPIIPASPQPVAGDGDGDGIDWPIAALVLAGALALGGGVGIAGHRLRTQTRPAH
jgi:hypothetical protein